MKKSILFLAVFISSQLPAATDKQLESIADMGNLNGVALQCRYINQVQRIKLALVNSLPKQRALGEWFEQSTNRSFMEFMEKDLQCPGTDEFGQDVDRAIRRLETVFAQ